LLGQAKRTSHIDAPEFSQRVRRAVIKYVSTRGRVHYGMNIYQCCV
jgi:hypothetical protein